MHILSYKIRIYCYYWLVKFGIFKKPTINYPETTINRQQALNLASDAPRTFDQELLLIMGEISRLATTKRTFATIRLSPTNLLQTTYALLQLGYAIDKVSNPQRGNQFIDIRWD